MFCCVLIFSLWYAVLIDTVTNYLYRKKNRKVFYIFVFVFSSYKPNSLNQKRQFCIDIRKHV